MVKNYQLGKIYKMESPNGLIYIGSTCHPTLAMRKAKHKDSYGNWKKNGTRYISSCDLFEEDKDNIDISLIENFPCNSKDELHAREGYYIKQFNCVNKRVAGRTRKEYREDNHEKILEHKKQYYENNKEKISSKSKQYFEQNKEKLLEQKRQYNLIHKDRINEHRGQVITCCCGFRYTLRHKARHLQTKRHLNYMKSNNAQTLEELEEEFNNI